MCGIFGCAGAIPIRKRRSLISALAVFNQSRGKDSTGIAILYADGEHGLIKRAVPASDFIQLDEFDLCMNRESSDFLTIIGHCRLPTMGKVTDTNAHPFRMGNVVGTHNGIVSNINYVREFCESKGSGKYDVDSKYLVWLLSHQGNVQPADGALTLAWFNRNRPDTDNILNLARHNRPLSYAVTKSGTGIVYSSESGHLETAAAIAGVKLQPIKEIQNFSAVSVHVDSSGQISVFKIRNFFDGNSK